MWKNHVELQSGRSNTDFFEQLSRFIAEIRRQRQFGFQNLSSEKKHKKNQLKAVQRKAV